MDKKIFFYRQPVPKRVESRVESPISRPSTNIVEQVSTENKSNVTARANISLSEIEKAVEAEEEKSREHNSNSRNFRMK